MPPFAIDWGHDALHATITVSDDGAAHLTRLTGTGDGDAAQWRVGQPLVELVTADDRPTHVSPRYSDTPIGLRLSYRSHELRDEGGRHELRVDLADASSGLEVGMCWSSLAGIAAIRSCTEVVNSGAEPVTLEAVSSLALGWPTDADPDRDRDLDLLGARSDWVAKSRWHREPVRRWLLPDVDGPAHGHPRGRVAVTSRGSWSTGTHLPMGVLVHGSSGQAWAWQVEHNGPWHWELGERRDGWYLTASGPTDAEHRWSRVLRPGDRFTSVPAVVALGAGGVDGVVGELTRHRRAARRDHIAMRDLPIVFNDYMNTLMGDPTTDRLHPLIDAAAEVGAEYFCIDAGWYDDGGAWWGSVGAWRPSTVRFPGGLEEVLERIRSAGMRPGLWLEPEVVGVRSPVAEDLPDDAFFQRGGRRIVVSDRYHLDLRHPAAVAHLDAVVDRLVVELGVAYLKLDYNIDPGGGTDVDAHDLGDGLLGHNRAHLAWLDAVSDRHPELVLENCSSGAMRMDPALLARVQLQSTSDQQDPLRYPPIAAAAPMLVPPEQAGNWAYPQPHMDDEAIAFTLCTGLAGRLYLSGHLDGMSGSQRSLVAAGVAVAKRLRRELADGLPFWPLGLPAWTDPWVAFGRRTAQDTWLVVWHRRSTPDRTVLSLPHLRDRRIAVHTVFPEHLAELATSWDRATGSLGVTSPCGPLGRVLALSDRS